MSQPAPVLPERPRRGRGLTVVLPLVVALVVAVVAVLAFRGGGSSGSGTTAAASSPAGSSGPAAPSSGGTVSIGVSDKESPYWRTYTALAKERLGVTVELVGFSDYSLPNPALAQQQIDINQFQHVQYLANYNTTSGDDLQPIGATAVYPLPLYSTSVKTPADLPEGATVAVPNDAVNEARALLSLQAAGLLSLRDGGTPFSTAADVTSSKVKVVPVVASQTAGALQSGSAAAAVVNNDYATSAGLPTSDVIYSADAASPAAAPYTNLFVVRKADTGNPTYLALAALIHDPAVQAEFTKTYPAAVVRTTSAADLQAELAQVEAQARAAKKP